MELTPEQSRRRESRDELVRALQPRFKGKAVYCQFHDDKNPSGSIHHDADGAWRFHCFVCKLKLDVFDVIARKEGRQLADVLKDARGEEQKPTIYPTLDKALAVFQNTQAVYKYTNPESGELDLVVVRYVVEDRKRFAQISPRGDGWALRGLDGKYPIYNRTRVQTSEYVVVVEGEKAVHALAEIGIVATTSPGGAGKAGKADWSMLKGKKVYLWPDNDPRDPQTGKSLGEQHMKDVQAILETMDCELFWIDPAGLGLADKGDAHDFVYACDGERSDKRIAVQLVLDEAVRLGASRDLEARFESIFSGEWVNIEWPWHEMSAEAQALIPGTVTALCGEPGAAKSLLLLEAFWHWHLEGQKVALFMLEDDRTYHLNRTLAQLEQNAYLTQTDWIANNQDKARSAMSNQRDIIDSFGRVVYDAPDRIVTLTELAEWFEARCKEGATICGIDPVTAAQTSEKPWIDDQKFIFQVKTIAKQYRSRLVYVIHPRVANGKAGPTLSRLAGGAAYSRFSHSVFWLLRHDQPLTSVMYSSDFGKRQVTHERTLKIAKARNGRGAGGEIGFSLNPETLCFSEYGMIVENVKQTRIEV